MILKYQKEGQLKEYIKECSDRAESPYRFLLNFFSKKKGKVLLTFFLWTCQRSPCWVIPLATANILDALSGAEQNVTAVIIKTCWCFLFLSCRIFYPLIWQPKPLIK